MSIYLYDGFIGQKVARRGTADTMAQHSGFARVFAADYTISNALPFIYLEALTNQILFASSQNQLLSLIDGVKDFSPS